MGISLGKGRKGERERRGEGGREGGREGEKKMILNFISIFLSLSSYSMLHGI